MLDESLERLIQRELREIDVLLSRADELLNIAENEEPSFERLAAFLEWRSMENLVGQLADTWRGIRSEIQRFLDRPESLVPKAPAPAML